MILGITGSRVGITLAQLTKLLEILKEYEVNEIHHGCCKGADEMAVVTCYNNGIKIVAHPPTNPKVMSVKSVELSSLVMPKAPYLNRNKDIVNASEMLVALPNTNEEELRSGTWSTVRYARKKARMITIIYPDGEVAIETRD